MVVISGLMVSFDDPSPKKVKEYDIKLLSFKKKYVTLHFKSEAHCLWTPVCSNGLVKEV